VEPLQSSWKKRCGYSCPPMIASWSQLFRERSHTQDLTKERRLGRQLLLGYAGRERRNFAVEPILLLRQPTKQNSIRTVSNDRSHPSSRPRCNSTLDLGSRRNRKSRQPRGCASRLQGVGCPAPSCTPINSKKNSDAARQCTLNPPRRMPASLNASIRAALVPVTHITVVDFGIGYPRACVGKHIAGAATITVH
jgi:hypothetical protein